MLTRGRAVVPVASLPTRKEYLQQAYKVFLLIVILYYVLTLAYVGYVESDFPLALVLASLLLVCCMASVRLGSFIRSSGYLNELTASTIHNSNVSKAANGGWGEDCELEIQTRIYQAVLVSMLMGFAGGLADLQKSTLSFAHVVVVLVVFVPVVFMSVALFVAHDHVVAELSSFGFVNKPSPLFAFGYLHKNHRIERMIAVELWQTDPDFSKLRRWLSPFAIKLW